MILTVGDAIRKVEDATGGIAVHATFDTGRAAVLHYIDTGRGLSAETLCSWHYANPGDWEWGVPGDMLRKGPPPRPR